MSTPKQYANGYGDLLTIEQIMERHFASATSEKEAQDRLVKMAEIAYTLLTEDQKLVLANAITPYIWKEAP